MKNTTILLLPFLLIGTTLQAQKKKKVWTLTDGDQLLKQGKVQQAKEAYLQLYRYDSSFYENNYQLAVSYSLLRMTDSAFHYLYRSVDTNYSLQALSDPKLYSLRSDSRWEHFEDELIRRIQQKYEAHNPIPNTGYAKKLFRLKATDQAYYYEDELIQKQIGEESVVRNLIWDLKKQLNDSNLKELEKLIAEEGWPKYSEVGPAASAAFLVIQHADSAHQRKYLPLLQKACEEKEASWQEYALMYDRLQVEAGFPQRYGSQVHYIPETKKWELYPLENKKEVDNYRKEMGLGPLKDYVKQWNIEW